MRIVKYIAISLLLGVAFTGLTMLIPYENCMDGNARGFPLGVIAPSCGPPFGPAIKLEPDMKNGHMFDFGALLGDAVLWSVIFGFTYCRLVKLRDKKLSDKN
jgi:hypothetical protein